MSRRVLDDRGGELLVGVDVDHLENEVRDGKQGLLAFSPAIHPEYESALPYIGYLTSVALGSVIEDTPTLGISSQMHVAVVRSCGLNDRIQELALHAVKNGEVLDEQHELFLVSEERPANVSEHLDEIDVAGEADPVRDDRPGRQLDRRPRPHD